MNKEELIEAIKEALTPLNFDLEQISDEKLIETFLVLHRKEITDEDLRKLGLID